MQGKGKILGLDYGTKRIGVAISDADKTMTFPRDAMVYKDISEVIRKLHLMCETDNVQKIVIGLPIEMDGQMGASARAAMEFGSDLGKTIPGITVEYFDERLSTAAAQRMMSGAGITAKEQRSLKDSVSAQLILEGYLGSLR
jgi:putative Holliday junction resolvase